MYACVCVYVIQSEKETERESESKGACVKKREGGERKKRGKSTPTNTHTGIRSLLAL